MAGGQPALGIERVWRKFLYLHRACYPPNNPISYAASLVSLCHFASYYPTYSSLDYGSGYSQPNFHSTNYSTFYTYNSSYSNNSTALGQPDHAHSYNSN